jgi:hypothetical protein
MDKYYELDEDTIGKFFEIFNKKSIPVDIGFQFIGCSKQKELIKIKKISDEYAFVLSKAVLVSINDDLMSVFDDESIAILIEQELDKISYNVEDGKIKMQRTDLNTFSSIINKYGVEKVAKANMIGDLYHDQKRDGTTTDEEFIV